MVLQDGRLAAAQSGRDALALVELRHHSAVAVEDDVVFVEGAGVLGQRAQRAAQRRERLAVHRVAVGRGHHVGAGRVDLGVDGERGPVQEGTLAVDDVAVRVHPDQVRGRDVGERHAPRVDPERLGILGVADGHMARGAHRAVLEAELGEDPVSGGQTLLAVLALLLHRVEGGQVPLRFLTGCGLDVVAGAHGRIVAPAGQRFPEGPTITGSSRGRATVLRPVSGSPRVRRGPSRSAAQPLGAGPRLWW